MKVFWLNDALSIQAENAEERHSLAVLLKGLGNPETYKEEDDDPAIPVEQDSEPAISS